MDKLNEIDNGENARLLLEEYFFFSMLVCKAPSWDMSTQS